MNRIKQNNLLLFTLHILFWLVYVSYRIYDVHEYTGIEKAFVYICFPLLFTLTATYLHYFLIQPYILQKQFKKYFTFLFLLLVVTVSSRIVAENIVFPQYASSDVYFKTVEVSRVISTVWDTLAFLVFWGLIKFTLDRFRLENQQKQLQNEKLLAELNYLRAQINPHFLFNTLHNINYLVHQKSDKATGVIIKLSDLMRYMMYDAIKEKVFLQQELDFMQAYIDLQSIRINSKVDFKFELTGNPQHVWIAPLLLITLLENAFKHGIREDEPGLFIHQQLSINEEEIRYEVKNIIVAPDASQVQSGFGLGNLRKRLSLLYPEKHTLQFEIRENIYSIKLIVQR
ncbi:MAG: sensor histidine kinase [Chryseotalea sp.]